MKEIFSINGACFITWVFFITSCSFVEKKQGDSEEATHNTGEKLAKTHCSSCHLFPEPDLLDKKTWRDQALPAMGYRFGIYRDRTRESLIEKGMAGRVVEQANIFPITQRISDEEWESIVQYYIAHAPETLPESVDTIPFKKSPPFEAIIPDFKIAKPAVSALAYNDRERLLYVADCSRESHSSITVLDRMFKPITSLGLPHPVSNIAVHRNTLYILSMGHFVPSDEPAGQLIRAVKNVKGEYEGYQRVVKNLKRPVDVAYSNLDGDGKEDIVVCEFGNHVGSVSLFRAKENDSFDKEILLRAPGAIKVAIEDVDLDNRNDIAVLMAQGDEGLDIYFNKGEGKFEGKRVLRFPPVYGSVSFCLADMNKDGYKDIVCVNGDNADASRVLKPYHGIRIYLNDGNNSFAESFFLPMHGAYQAIARDFDKDDDIDIAAIAFFPDFQQHPEQGFIYLENTSGNNGLTFSPGVIQESVQGRWITMISHDVDLDGFDDLILGSFTSMFTTGDTASAQGYARFSMSSPVLVLKNATASHSR